MAATEGPLAAAGGVYGGYAGDGHGWGAGDQGGARGMRYQT
nr:hypothetical protein [Gynuella sunshinyii]